MNFGALTHESGCTRVDENVLRGPSPRLTIRYFSYKTVESVARQFPEDLVLLSRFSLASDPCISSADAIAKICPSELPHDRGTNALSVFRN